MSWLFPIDKNTENPNLVMTSLLNNLDAADNNIKEPDPTNVVEERAEEVTLVDILICKDASRDDEHTVIKDTR